MSVNMSDIFHIPEPKTLPTGSIDITFEHSKLIKLDSVVRNLRRMNKSDRALKIEQLKVNITEMKISIPSARANIREGKREQERVISEKISHMNRMYREHGKESELYKTAQSSIYAAQKRD